MSTRSARDGFTTEEVSAAYGGICRLRCEVCNEHCTTSHRYSHIHVHCGRQVVHDLHDLRARIIRNPRAAGYAVYKRCLEFTAEHGAQVHCTKPPGHAELTHWGKDADGRDVVWQAVTIEPLARAT